MKKQDTGHPTTFLDAAEPSWPESTPYDGVSGKKAKSNATALSDAAPEQLDTIIAEPPKKASKIDKKTKKEISNADESSPAIDPPALLAVSKVLEQVSQVDQPKIVKRKAARKKSALKQLGELIISGSLHSSFILPAHEPLPDFALKEAPVEAPKS